ncbi:MAG: flagellar biosynthesis protein FliQ [Gammaproteobacteria bacterium]
MTPETVITLAQRTLEATAWLAAPLLITALVVGVIVGLFQAATQLNEMTLSFVPKLLAMALVLLFAGAWMLGLLVDFTIQLFHDIPHLIG